MDTMTTKLLDSDEIAEIKTILEQSTSQQWLDGRLTAGEFAAQHKQNKQLAPDCPAGVQAIDLISSKLRHLPLVRSFALTKKIHSVILSRSDVGDGYGWHVDNPFSKYGRRDLSFTLFLNDPTSYDGGELSIQGVQEAVNIKLPAGHIIVYPSSSLHCVHQVQRGSRLVCVGWIESYVRAFEDRLLLFHLDAGAKGLLARHGRSDELDLIFQAYANAVRRFSCE